MNAVPRDAAMPQLGLALDESAMTAEFGQVLKDQGLQVESCRVERIKYRPQRNCTLSYLLRLRDADGTARLQRVAARLCGDGDSARRAARAATRSWEASLAGPAVLHLNTLDMTTHWWPNDARLDAPRVFANETALRTSVLPEVVSVLTAGQGTLIAHQIDLVQYVPEDRLCARVLLRWCARDDAQAEHECVLFAKAEREAHGSATHALMQAVAASPLWRSDRLRTPRSVLWQAAHGLHWQEGLPGRPLLDFAPQVDRANASGVGLQLAALHRVAAPIERACTLEDLRRQPNEVARVLGLVDPEWKPALTRLTAGLEHGVSLLARSRQVTLHGDLHPRNVLLAGPQLSLIDLDSAQRGPAVLDLGAWIADALYRALLQGISPALTTASWQAFLAGYAAGGGEVIDETEVAWATAYQLLCQRAWRCVVNLKPGRFELTPRLIELAETILRAGTPHVSGRIDAALASPCLAEAH